MADLLNDGGERRVLVVDDDEPIRSLIAAIFERSDHGVRLDFAPDGDTALRQIRQCDYEAVVLDLMLPKRNGFELIREVKSAKPHLLRRVIVVTAASDQTLRDFEDGSLVRTVIRKPFDIRQLVETIVSCCNGE